MRYGQKALLPDPGKFPDEKALASFVLGELDQWFHIDAVLRPRDPGGWHDEGPAFGVEFKSLAPNTST
ncbi:hypothetical protein, partial [Streptomyces caniferus]